MHDASGDWTWISRPPTWSLSACQFIVPGSRLVTVPGPDGVEQALPRIETPETAAILLRSCRLESFAARTPCTSFSARAGAAAWRWSGRVIAACRGALSP